MEKLRRRWELAKRMDRDTKIWIFEILRIGVIVIGFVIFGTVIATQPDVPSIVKTYVCLFTFAMVILTCAFNIWMCNVFIQTTEMEDEIHQENSVLISEDTENEFKKEIE